MPTSSCAVVGDALGADRGPSGVSYVAPMGTAIKRYQSVVSDSARWSEFDHRPGDIIISTPPKCGTTLTQMLCALLVFDSPQFPERLDDLSPWFDMNTRSDDDVLAQVEAMTHRRFIKTHTPLDGIPYWPDVSYVVVARDPRDVFVSWEHHTANIDSERFAAAVEGGVGLDAAMVFYREHAPTEAERLDRWLVDDVLTTPMSLAVVAGHVEVAWQRRDRANVGLFHFHDLRDNRVAVMEQLAALFGIEITRDRLVELAEAASLDNMRARADELAPNTKEIFSSSAGFFRSGRSGEGQALMTADQEAVYDRRMRELLPTDLRVWLHQAD